MVISEADFYPNSVDVITFDLDDTLWDNSEAVHKAEALLLAKLFQDFPKVRLAWTDEAIATLKSETYQRYGLSRGMTFLRSHWLSTMLESSGYPVQGSVATLMEYFITHRSQVDLLPGVKDSLVRLQQRYRLFALTNGNVDLKIAGVRQYFEDVINPDKIQRAKPDPSFYKVAEAHIGVNARRILHVGDGWINDVLASTSAGYQAAWFNPGNATLPEMGLAAFHFASWQQFLH